MIYGRLCDFSGLGAECQGGCEFQTVTASLAVIPPSARDWWVCVHCYRRFPKNCWPRTVVTVTLFVHSFRSGLSSLLSATRFVRRTPSTVIFVASDGLFRPAIVPNSSTCPDQPAPIPICTRLAHHSLSGKTTSRFCVSEVVPALRPCAFPVCPPYTRAGPSTRPRVLHAVIPFPCQTVGQRYYA